MRLILVINLICLILGCGNMKHPTNTQCYNLFENVSFCISNYSIMEIAMSDTIYGDYSSDIEVVNEFLLVSDNDSTIITLSFNTDLNYSCNDLNIAEELNRQSERLQGFNKKIILEKEILTINDVKFAYVHDAQLNTTRLAGCILDKIIFIDIQSSSEYASHKNMINQFSLLFN